MPWLPNTPAPGIPLMALPLTTTSDKIRLITPPRGPQYAASHPLSLAGHRRAQRSSQWCEEEEGGGEGLSLHMSCRQRAERAKGFNTPHSQLC